MTSHTPPHIANVAPDHDIVVVGFGPVGSTLAALLARRGLRVLVVDRETEIFPLPRAAHFDHEVMRVLQELGCTDEVGPATILNPGMEFITASGEVLLSVHSGDLTPSGWPASILFHQPDLELVLRDVAERSGATVRLGVAVSNVTDHGDHVMVSFADGTATTSTYVVACDGARSTVRKQLGISMHDLGFEEPWLVADLVLNDAADRPSLFTLQVCDPMRPTTLVPMPPPRFRFEFMLLPGDDPVGITSSESVASLLAPWMDPADATVERAAVYSFHGLIATEWRRGRVLLAGDAAHQTPPFLGQGMCSGIRDAQNLAWKLARVLHGTSPDALLDTYQLEREPQVRSIIQLAVDLGRVICTTDPEAAALRDAGMLAARAAGGGTMGQALMPSLPEGPLVALGAGGQARQPIIDGTRLDDIAGDRFVVVLRTAAQRSNPGVAFWSAQDALVLDADTTPEVATVLDAVHANAMVVRPDRYVLVVGSELEEPDPALRMMLNG